MTSRATTQLFNSINVWKQASRKEDLKCFADIIGGTNCMIRPNKHISETYVFVLFDFCYKNLPTFCPLPWGVIWFKLTLLVKYEMPAPCWLWDNAEACFCIIIMCLSVLSFSLWKAAQGNGTSPAVWSRERQEDRSRRLRGSVERPLGWIVTWTSCGGTSRITWEVITELPGAWPVGSCIER